jgi:hypothetical protein
MTGVHETVRTLRPNEMQKVGDKQKKCCPKKENIANVRGQQEWLAQKTIKHNTWHYNSSEHVAKNPAAMLKHY